MAGGRRHSYGWEVNHYLLAATIGYRALSANYSANYGAAASGLDILMHGPLIGFSVKF